MKKILLILFCFITCAYCQLLAQDGTNTIRDLEGLIKFLQDSGEDQEKIDLLVEGIIENPDYYNKAWAFFIKRMSTLNASNWGFLKDLNVDFKTLQSDEDSSQVSLGFSYDFSFDWSKFEISNKGNRNQTSFSINAKGLVAFKNNVNPTDFLESEIKFSKGTFKGGLLNLNEDTFLFTKKNKIEDVLVNLKDPHGKGVDKLWFDLGEGLIFSNQTYYGLDFSAGIESNQDLSKFQYKGGLHLGLGVNSWNEKSVLSKLNIFDYPFAVLRRITKTDRKLKIRGSAIPSALIGIDYIIPTENDERKEIEGELNPFPRFKFEIGYRTLVSQIEKQSIFFAANYRFYQEIGASKEIKTNNLDQQSYLVLALQSSKGFYVSYSYGKLPFDKKDDEVYELGFNYNF